MPVKWLYADCLLEGAFTCMLKCISHLLLQQQIKAAVSLCRLQRVSVCTKQAVLSGMRRELLTAVPHDPRTLICVLM